MRQSVMLELGMNDSNEPAGFDLTISVRAAKEKAGAPSVPESPIIAVVCGSPKHKNVAKVMAINDILLAEDRTSKVEIRYVRFDKTYGFMVMRL